MTRDKFEAIMKHEFPGYVLQVKDMETLPHYDRTLDRRTLQSRGWVQVHLPRVWVQVHLHGWEVDAGGNSPHIQPCPKYSDWPIKTIPYNWEALLMLMRFDVSQGRLRKQPLHDDPIL